LQLRRIEPSHEKNWGEPVSALAKGGAGSKSGGVEEKGGEPNSRGCQVGALWRAAGGEINRGARGLEQRGGRLQGAGRAEEGPLAGAARRQACEGSQDAEVQARGSSNSGGRVNSQVTVSLPSKVRKIITEVFF